MKILLSLLTIAVLKIIVAQNSKTQDLKVWENICRILSCKPVLDNCIRNNCMGKDECRNCVQSENSICVRCVDGLLNDQIFTINGTQTIICDPVNSLHQTTCNFYCRMKEGLRWKCELIEGNPLCRCRSEPLGSLISKKTIK
jgi:hypothetical protein